ETAYRTGDLQYPDPAAEARHQFHEPGAMALHESGIAQHDQGLGFAIAAQQRIDALRERAPVETVEIPPVVEDPDPPGGAVERGVERGDRMHPRIEALVAEFGAHVHGFSIAPGHARRGTAGRAGL